MVRYRAVVLVLLFAVFPMRASFPCDVAEPTLPGSSPWDWRGYTEEDTVFGPAPRIFALTRQDVPEVRREGESTAIEFVVVDAPELNEVKGLFVLAPSAPLSPGRYCAEAKCITVVAEPPQNGLPPTSALVIASEPSGSSGCGDATKCGGSDSRQVTIAFRDLAPSYQTRVANWLIELAEDTTVTSRRVVLLGNNHSVLNLDFLLQQLEYDLDQLDQVCARLTPVLWDGSLGPMIDAGCSKFE